MRAIIRRVVVSVAAVVTIVALFAIVATPAIVFPRSDDVGALDAVVILGPPQPARVQVAEDLVDATGARALVIATSDGGWSQASRLSACERDDADCFVPDPFTTRGEAAYVQALAEENGWTAVAVVTQTSHVSRARYIFDRCVDIPVAVVDSRSGDDWAFQYLYQTVAWAKAVIVGCV